VPKERCRDDEPLAPFWAELQAATARLP
jgi:hypothetical protein